MALGSVPIDTHSLMIRWIKQKRERRLKNGGHLFIADQWKVRRHNRDHRRDVIAGDRLVTVSRADDIGSVIGQSNFFIRFAQSCSHGISIARVHPAAGKRDLAWMAAHRIRSLGQNNTRFAPVCNCDQHSGGFPVLPLGQRV